MIAPKVRIVDMIATSLAKLGADSPRQSNVVRRGRPALRLHFLHDRGRVIDQLDTCRSEQTPVFRPYRTVLGAVSKAALVLRPPGCTDEGDRHFRRPLHPHQRWCRNRRGALRSRDRERVRLFGKQCGPAPDRPDPVPRRAHTLSDHADRDSPGRRHQDLLDDSRRKRHQVDPGLPKARGNRLGLSMRLPVRGNVSARILDATGREVSWRSFGFAEAGTRHWDWQPVDPQGRELTSGNYWIRVQTPAGTVQRRWAHVK